jgi:carnitine O-acetyltransferase
MVLDNFYSLPVVDSNSGDPISTEKLEAGLWAIADDASSRGQQDSVGVLSADDRDTWAKAREHLLALSPVNRASATQIEDSLFVLSLDAYTLHSDIYKSSSPSTNTPDLDAHIKNASSAGGSGRNRWWDKAVGIHVESNGRASMVGEHSPCDALIPSIVCDYALAEDLDPSGGSKRGEGKLEGEPLKWVLDGQTKESIKKAEEVVQKIAADSEGRMLWFDEYGAGWIKTVGAFFLSSLSCTHSPLTSLSVLAAKQPPDAYLQMALQLAYHKSQNAFTATYETASTRLFARGRTEVIRTLSEDSWRWVMAMREGKENVRLSSSSMLVTPLTFHRLTAFDTLHSPLCCHENAQPIHPRLLDWQRHRSPLHGSPSPPPRRREARALRRRALLEESGVGVVDERIECGRSLLRYRIRHDLA